MKRRPDGGRDRITMEVERPILILRFPRASLVLDYQVGLLPSAVSDKKYYVY